MKTDAQQQSDLWKLDIHPELFATSNIYDGDGSYICRITELDEDTRIAERIVSCVNAMDGIEDPKKLREAWEVCKDLELDSYHKLKAEHDKLFSSFKDTIEHVERLENIQDKLMKQREEVTDMLTKVKAHLINIDPYFSSPKMVEQIDQVLEKYIS